MGKDEALADPLRVGPKEEVGTSSWSLKVKDPPELPSAWLVGGLQPFMLPGLSLGGASGWDELHLLEVLGIPELAQHHRKCHLQQCCEQEEPHSFICIGPAYT